MKPLKVKILGSGNAAQKHRLAFAELPELYQIADSGDRDIIDLCTPNHAHFKMACSRLGTEHVIVEKPLCGSLKEVDSLAKFEQLSGNRICPIFQYRFAGHDALQPIIKSLWKRDPQYYSGWRGQWVSAIGGGLTSHGIHILDLIIQEHGSPYEVVAHMLYLEEVDFLSQIYMRWPKKMQFLSVFTNAKEGGDFNLGDSHTGYVNQFRLIHEALTTGGPLPVTLEEARQSLEVLTACYSAAYTGNPVTLPITPSHPFYSGWSKHFAQRAQHTPASPQISV